MKFKKKFSYNFSIFLLSLISISGFGQEWKPLGPFKVPPLTQNSTRDPGIGRMSCIVTHSLDKNIIYAGAPAGGLWKGIITEKNSKATVKWEALTDNILPVTIGVASIVINPVYPDSIYFLSGDADQDFRTSWTVGIARYNGVFFLQTEGNHGQGWEAHLSPSIQNLEK